MQISPTMRPLRRDVDFRARLARLLTERVPHEPEVIGLLALMLSYDACHATRISVEGVLIPLEE